MEDKYLRINVWIQKHNITTQRQTAATAYINSKQLLLFAFITHTNAKSSIKF